MVNLDHMYRKRLPHTSFWRSLPGSAEGIGCTMAPSAIGPYSDGILNKVLVDGGFMTAADMRYHFFVTDHLGNVRVVVNDAGMVEQENQFYPYGEATDMGQALPASVDKPYKWGGKEWDEDQGAYDFGARMYSAADARWATMDPLCEKYYSISPYAYCAGNPVNMVDPEGRDWFYYSIDGVSDPTWNLRDKTKVEGLESIKVQVIRSDIRQINLNCFFDNTITAIYKRK